MEINGHLRILLILVVLSFGITTLSFSPAWAATSGSKQTLKKPAKRHVSPGARRIKQISGSYVAENKAKQQNIASTPATVCYGRWEQSWYGPVYVSWCPATANSQATTGQTRNWATPAGASNGRTGMAPAAGGYATQPPPVNAANPPPGSVCYNGCVPYWTPPAYSWCQPATASTGTSVQTGGWTAPAQSGGYVASPQPQNVSTQPSTACSFWNWWPCT